MRISRKVLPNGLRLITIPMQDTATITALVLVEAGSKYETKKNNGISHFLEHMCFKGTVKRPSPRMISHELDALGSQYNAFTGQEYTGYYVKADTKHFRKLFDVLSDIYLNSTFPVEEMEKEKGVIVEEINMYEDMPQRHIQDLFMSLVYGDQPAGWNIAGTRENVKQMTREDFTTYKRAHYVPKATSIIVAGKMNQALVTKQVQQIFAKLPNTKKDTKLATRDTQTKPQVLIKHKATDQTHVVIGVRAFPTYDKRNFPLQVLTTVLGSGMSSRLFVKLREELGVAYYVRAGVDTYTDHGCLEIRAGITTERLVEVVQHIIDECKMLTTTLVPEAELKKAKEYMIGTLKIDLESSDAYAMYYGEQEILRKKLLTPKEVEAQLRKVTSKDIQAIAKTIFQNNRLNIAVIGPHKDPTKLVKLFHF